MLNRLEWLVRPPRTIVGGLPVAPQCAEPVRVHCDACGETAVAWTLRQVVDAEGHHGEQCGTSAVSVEGTVAAFQALVHE